MRERHQRTKEYLISLPYQRIPKDERWIKDDGPGTPERELKWGISLREFGFGWSAIPNEEEAPKNRPPDFPKYFSKMQRMGIIYGLVLPDEDFLFCQNWVDRDRVLELIDEPDFTPVFLAQYGKYHWCSNGTHRVVAAKLTGRRVLALTGRF